MNELELIKNQILAMETLMAQKIKARNWAAVAQLAENIKEKERQLPAAMRIELASKVGCGPSVCADCSCGKAQRL